MQKPVALGAPHPCRVRGVVSCGSRCEYWNLLFLIIDCLAMSTTTATTTTTSHPPQVHCQMVVFLRHGVAQHNYRGADLTSPTLFDPSLTFQGKLGAVQAGEKIKAWLLLNRQSTTSEASSSSSLDLIVCSPLTRTLQTATLAFSRGEDYGNDRPVPVVCVENVREAFGMHYPDKRRERSLLVVG